MRFLKYQGQQRDFRSTSKFNLGSWRWCVVVLYRTSSGQKNGRARLTPRSFKTHTSLYILRETADASFLTSRQDKRILVLIFF
jgi:hypothetical protein